MAFVAKCATRRTKKLIGHTFLFAEQGNWVRIPNTLKHAYAYMKEIGEFHQ